MDFILNRFVNIFDFFVYIFFWGVKGEQLAFLINLSLPDIY